MKLNHADTQNPVEPTGSRCTLDSVRSYHEWAYYLNMTTHELEKDREDFQKRKVRVKNQETSGNTLQQSALPRAPRAL